MPETLVERRLFFSANPGRSGSGYLADLLDACPDVDAGHERLPAMVDRWLRRVSYQGAAESIDERRVKAVAVRAELADLAPGIVYADTSHMFLKTFADVVLDEFDHSAITVIALRRDLIDTVRSFVELDEFGPGRRPWHDFLPVATAPHARFPLHPTELTSRFDLILAYLIDTVVRAEELRVQAPEVRWVNVDLAEVSTGPGVVDLCVRLGIEPPEDVGRLVAARPNRKLVEKAAAGQAASIALVKARLHDFCDRFDDRPGLNMFRTWFELERDA